MTTSSEEPTGDEFWRRPPATPEGDLPRPAETGRTAGAAAGTPYPGPPVGTPPPAGWRPPLHVQPAPPRPLPAQDHSRVDAEERGARTVTYGVGMIVTAILVVVICLLCSRVVF